MGKKKVSQPDKFGENIHFKQGLAYELGDRVPVNYDLALKAYQKGANQGHFLSQLKVNQSKLRLATLLPLLSIGVLGLLWGAIANAFWLGAFVFFLTGLGFYLIDYRRYWYKTGFAFRFQQVYFYVSLIVFLPLSALLPYLNGVTYFPLVGLLVIGFFITATGVILLWTTREKLHWFIAAYGLGMFTFSLLAYQIPTEDIKYSFIEVAGGVEITRYRSSDPHVEIPEVLNNLPVVGIKANAFANTEIESLFLGKHIQYVGANAFAYNDHLISVTIESGVPISAGMFSQCINLAEINLPEDINVIPSYFLSGATSLETIELPSQLVEIQSFAFYQTKIHSFELPSSLTKIGAYAFASNLSLTTMVIPDQVYQLGTGLLADNPNLTTVQLPNQLTSIPAFFLDGATSLTSITLPPQIEFIGAYAFQNNRQLTEILLPNTLREFGEGVFRNNEQLTAIAIPEGVTSIPNYFLTNAYALTEIVLPSTIQTIGVSAFQNNLSLTNLSLPSQLKVINTNAFENTPLSTLVLPESLIQLGEGVFANNKVLQRITIPANITTISARLFDGASALTTVNFVGNIEEIGFAAFRRTTVLTDITFPSSLRNIGSYAFFGNKALTHLTFQEGLISIGAYAFYGLDNLEFVSLPNSLQRIEDGAFALNPKLTYIWLSQQVNFVGHYAFWGNSQLTIAYAGNAIPSTWLPTWNPDQLPVLLGVEV